MIFFLYLLFLISQPPLPPFTPVPDPRAPPPPPPPAPPREPPGSPAPLWVPQARLATRPQASAPARTASLASPATAAPRATSRAAHLWRPASVSDSHTHTHTHTHTITVPCMCTQTEYTVFSSVDFIYESLQNNCTFLIFSVPLRVMTVLCLWSG